MVPAAEPGARPVAGRDYPANFSEFLDWFQTDGECWTYLARLRWRDGFQCPACGSADAWLSRRLLYICAACGRQTSVTAGTIFAPPRGRRS